MENAFGILSACWRIFRKPLEVQPETADKLVLAACCLHNMLCKERDLPTEVEPLCLSTSAFHNTQMLRRNAPSEAFQVRESFKNYFNSPVGSLPWQRDVIYRGRIEV